MSDNDSGYWVRTVAWARHRSAPAPAEAETVAPEAVVPVHASEFQGVDAPTRRASLTADEMVQLGLGFGAHANVGYTPRSTDYAKAQHLAAGNTSLGAAPATTSSITPDTKGR